MRKPKGMRSFRLFKLECPECHSEQVRLVHSAGNWARIAADVAAGFLFLWPVLEYRWRCADCRHEFRAENVMER
jgi:ribosomal protein S27E